MNTCIDNTETYSAIFDSYDFSNNNKRIILKHVKKDSFYKERAYINALSVPYLIGRLIYRQILIIECPPITDDEIKKPIIINSREEDGS